MNSPITKRCSPIEEAIYQQGFQAGAASRDAEIAQLNKEAAEKFSALAKEYDQLRAELEYDQRNAAMSQSESARLLDENTKLRAELAAALAACKAKDEALLTCQTGDSSTGHVIHPSFDERLVESALAIQPHDSALKAWLGDPEWFCRKDANGVNVFYEDIEERPAGCTPLYSPKGLK